MFLRQRFCPVFELWRARQPDRQFAAQHKSSDGCGMGDIRCLSDETFGVWCIRSLVSGCSAAFAMTALTVMWVRVLPSVLLAPYNKCQAGELPH